MSDKEIKSTVLRLPAELFERLKVLAKKEGLSFNAFVVKLLENHDKETVKERIQRLEAQIKAIESRLEAVENKKA